MKTHREPARNLPVVSESDVVVAGGGPGGLPAAVAAARHGASVLLVERYGFLGGLATAGLVAPILGHTVAQGNGPGAGSRPYPPAVEGLLKETTARMHSLGGAPEWEESCREWGISFDAEAFKRVADDLVRESGVNLLLHTLVCDAIVEDGRVAGLILESKSGREVVLGKVIVDATGDADVAFRAGARITQGRSFDGLGMSAGSFFHIGGIADVTEAQRVAAVEEVRRAALGGHLRIYNPGITNRNAMYRDRWSPNVTRCKGDPTDARDLTAMELETRRDVWQIVSFLRGEVPGFENCYVGATSPQVGVRESRQAMGDYVLTGHDVVEGRKCEDAIARGSWWVDIHCPSGHTMPVHLCTKECVRQEACSFWEAEHETSMLSCGGLRPPVGDWYDIPYRCLTPKGVDRLLVSGRCMSADHQAMAGARVMGTCMAIGEAAGTAAAMAAQAGIGPRDVDVVELRRVLQADGALV